MQLFIKCLAVTYQIFIIFKPKSTSRYPTFSSIFVLLLTDDNK